MIHPQAIVHPEARLGARVSVGPFAVIEQGVTLGDGCEVHSFARVGGPPQHLKDPGEGTTLEVGPRTVIREFASLHRGTRIGTGRTVVGADCFLMVAAHVGHDCRVGNGVTLTNAVLLGGHIEVGDFAVFGGQAGVHQYCRIGTLAMIAGGAIVVQDVPPYCLAAGNHARLLGLNEVGLKRREVRPDVIRALRDAYRIIFRTGMPRAAALEKTRAELGSVPEVAKFVEFIQSSKRGTARHGST